MPRYSSYLISIAITAIACVALWQPASVHSQSVVPAAGGRQFRIIVGLKEPPKLMVKVQGTAPIKQINIVKNN